MDDGINVTIRKDKPREKQPKQQGDLKDAIEAALSPIRKELAELPRIDAINKLLEDAILKIEEKIEERIEQKIEERINEKIEENIDEALAARDSELAKRIEVLESNLVILEHLEQRVNDSEQYGRRLCLRFMNIDLPENGEKEDCVEKGPIRKELAELPRIDAINKLLEDAILKIEEKIEERIEQKIEERINEKIEENIDEALAARDSELAKRIEVLESNLVILEHLEQRVNDSEQYGRRLCLRFMNIDLPENGEKEDCVEKVGKIIEDLPHSFFFAVIRHSNGASSVNSPLSQVFFIFGA